MKKVLIYGGSSEISIELIKIIYKRTDKFIIFCRNKNILEKRLSELEYKIEKFEIHEVDLENLEKNLEIVKSINNLRGIYWVAGFTGKPTIEFQNEKDCKRNINVNFFHPLLIINNLISKLEEENDSFLAVVTSVAGLRGRSKNIFYGSAKAAMISYLSGLRQKYNKKITICTVIPGYISTSKFNIDAPKFLVSEPSKLAKKIVEGIDDKKEIVYCSFTWRIIMMIISLIPEKVFKNLKF